MEMVIMKFCRWLFGLIDRIIYSFIGTFYNMIIDIGRINLFQADFVNNFSRKIYIVLGLVMFFRMLLGLGELLINPDMFSDKNKGFSGILRRLIISMALMVFTPQIFMYATEAEKIIIEQIPKLVTFVVNDDVGNQLSSSGSETDDLLGSNGIGDKIAYYSFLGFFGYNQNCVNSNDGSIYTGGEIPETDQIIFNVDSATNNATVECSGNKKEFKYSYSFLLSSVVGFYMIFLLFSIAKDCAIRLFKLAICEIVAPIPICLYIDPKSGNERFNNWLKTTINIYMDLFINLAMVYLIQGIIISVLTIDNLTNILKEAKSLSSSSWSYVAIIYVLLIIGLISFAKEAPKFLTGLLGIKDNGKFAEMMKELRHPFKNSTLAKTVAAASAPVRGVARGVANSKIGQNLSDKIKQNDTFKGIEKGTRNFRNNAQKAFNAVGNTKDAVTGVGRQFINAASAAGDSKKTMSDVQRGAENIVNENLARKTAREQKLKQNEAHQKQLDKLYEGKSKERYNSQLRNAQEQVNEYNKTLSNVKQSEKQRLIAAEIQNMRQNGYTDAQITAELNSQNFRTRINAQLANSATYQTALNNRDNAVANLNNLASNMVQNEKAALVQEFQNRGISFDATLENKKQQLMTEYSSKGINVDAATIEKEAYQQITKGIESGSIEVVSNSGNVVQLDTSAIKNIGTNYRYALEIDANQTNIGEYLDKTEKAVSNAVQELSLNKSVMGEALSNKINAFLVQNPVSIKDFKNATSILEKAKNTGFKSLAMSKMWEQMGDPIVQNLGSLAATTGDVKFTGTLEEFAQLSQKVRDGTVTDADLSVNFVHKDGSPVLGSQMSEQLYANMKKSVEKKFAEKYIDEIINGRENPEIKKLNTDLVNLYDDLVMNLNRLPIPAELRKKYLDELDKNPGSFMKNAVDYSYQLQEIIRNYEQSHYQPPKE